MHILVVDDHPIFLAGVEFLLTSRNEDNHVRAVADAQTALDAIRYCNFDVVLLDLNLPGIDGAAMLHLMQCKGMTVPTLTMSAEVDGQRILQVYASGAKGFMPKSYSPKQMLGALDQVAKGETFWPECAQTVMARARRQSGQNVDMRIARAHGVTPRQAAVLDLLAGGFSNKEIARKLSLTEYTVKSHVRALFASLECKNRTACVRRAQILGMVANAA